MKESRGDKMIVFAVIELCDGRPVILNYHRNRDCHRLKNELSDPDVDRIRQIIRYPDKIGEIIGGEFTAPPSAKSVIDLETTDNPEWFMDDEGNRHKISPCQDCARF